MSTVRRLRIGCIIAVSFLLLCTAGMLSAAQYRNIDSVGAKRLLDQKKNVFLLDVRTPQEYAQARLRGSLLIPINEIERRLSEVPKNRPVLVLCAVGSRSNLVAGFLVNKGYQEVYNLTDGLMGWNRNGYPLDMGR